MRRTLMISKIGDWGLSVLSNPPSSVFIECPKGSEVLVKVGDSVLEGTPILKHTHHVDHSSISGRVSSVNGLVIIAATRSDGDETVKAPFLADDFPTFLEEIGLIGMGGGCFPAAIKSRHSKDVHTLVINAVECEPNATIDHSLLLHQSELVRIGAEAYADAIGATSIILAVRKNPDFVRQLKELFNYRIVQMPNVYPSGAERLILKRLIGSLPPAGILPFELGYLVHNTASLRAVGKALRDGISVLERPLTMHAPGHGVHLNVIVPLGMRIGDLLSQFGCSPNAGEMIVLGGLMMGAAGTSESVVHKGLTSIMILSTKEMGGKERSCINCASCHDVCPVGLHPSLMASAAREGRMKATLDTFISECLLCGACSAVCPSNIPLAQIFREERAR